MKYLINNINVFKHFEYFLEPNIISNDTICEKYANRSMYLSFFAHLKR